MAGLLQPGFLVTASVVTGMTKDNLYLKENPQTLGWHIQ
jgi:hypothetical protein